MHPPSVIEGPGFSLRPFRTEDAPALSAAIEESRPQLQRWQGIADKDGTVPLVTARIAQWAAAFEDRSRLQYGLIAPDDMVLGACALEHIDGRARTFQLGYWLCPSATGQGHMTAAVRLLTRMAFEALAARRVAIWTDVGNTRSVAVARRLGFTLEGHLRNERLDAAGNPQDTFVFARTSALGL
ncbi:GNAT family protein [Nitrospirillum sp. BR 11164]|uniref:GNAT family N-acetyltransferase n=1 Tax=Nitrospirillum sp. BR 11164 TaxID=3104324 RepID=UPI002B000257|nr:GNAT family protein [Nitrospirillum sp. BR 11164]MEA1652341.1 GNAT family protein [Nitrospirillum sp. BR 11164]